MPVDVLKRNNVKVVGKGTQPMLFAHGFGCDQNMWRYVTPAFTDDYRVVLFDYVGSGKSDAKAYDANRYAKLDGYAQDVLDVIHALDLRDIIFVGHSVSSMIGVLAANREPDRFANLILIGPSPRYIDDEGYTGGFGKADIDGLFEVMDKNFIGWANFLAPAIMKNPDRPELGEELTQSFCSTDPIIARRFAEATFYSDNRADLQHVRVPSLILQCSDDMVAPLPVGQYLSQNMPHSTMRVMNATGHCPHMSHPDETTYNALPQKATANVNCRMVPTSSLDEVRNTLARVIADTGVKITLTQTDELPHFPTSTLAIEPALMSAALDVTKKMWGDIPVIPVMSTGATDSHWLREAGIPSYGISGLFSLPGETNAHGRDEKLRVKSFYEGLDFLDQVVRRVAGGPTP